MPAGLVINIPSPKRPVRFDNRGAQTVVYHVAYAVHDFYGYCLAAEAAIGGSCVAYCSITDPRNPTSRVTRPF